MWVACSVNWMCNHIANDMQCDESMWWGVNDFYKIIGVIIDFRRVSILLEPGMHIWYRSRSSICHLSCADTYVPTLVLFPGGFITFNICSYVKMFDYQVNISQLFISGLFFRCFFTALQHFNSFQFFSSSFHRFCCWSFVVFDTFLKVQVSTSDCF